MLWAYISRKKLIELAFMLVNRGDFAMLEETERLTNLYPGISELQDQIRKTYSEQNKTAKMGQIVFVDSSLMEIFPI